MEYPYFTLPDSLLIRSGGGRDPLGLKPIWSAFGRGLVPNLASPVSQVSGIKAILFIHWLYEKPLGKFFSEGDRSFRGFFRLMEGLLEYYLWSMPAPLTAICYGIRALSADGTDFRVTAKDSRTAVNGLYQYYRGTCRRASLLDNEWAVSVDVHNVLSKCWNDKASVELENALRTPLSDDKEALTPSVVLKQCPEFNKALQAIFNSLELRIILQKQLLGEPCHVAFAEKCAALKEQEVNLGEVGWIHWCFNQLDDWMQNDNCQAKILRGPLNQALNCEPFLLILQDCFDFMLASPGDKIADLSINLQKFKDNIQHRASAFLTLSTSLETDRMKQMLSLAEASLSNIDVFLTAILDHHKKCMNERGRDPQVLSDGGKIIVPVASEREKDSILKSLESGIPWANGYYLWNAGQIYRQIFGGAA